MAGHHVAPLGLYELVRTLAPLVPGEVMDLPLAVRLPGPASLVAGVPGRPVRYPAVHVRPAAGLRLMQGPRARHAATRSGLNYPAGSVPVAVQLARGPVLPLAKHAVLLEFSAASCVPAVASLQLPQASSALQATAKRPLSKHAFPGRRPVTTACAAWTPDLPFTEPARRADTSAAACSLVKDRTARETSPPRLALDAPVAVALPRGAPI
mmetsp:Transcript_15601/g.45621  ORF Transcript_15601/g.45621 Transcript_15601/m.45621 type:complete len:210 (-) Transcript_15601:638-1267(-)